MPSTRRFLTVLVLELKYSGIAVQRLAPDEIQTGFELFWHSFYRFVSDEGGVPLPPQSQEFIALFGAESPYADHAVRASKAAAAISSWLREWAFKFSLTGREIPHFSIALHSGESVAMQIPGSDTLPWAVVGEALSFSRTLIRVCRQDEVICSESFLTSFLGALPPGQESHAISTEEEPDLSGLNWDVAEFIPLEPHLRNRTVLVGGNVAEVPEGALLWFTYLYAFSDPDTGAVARVAAVLFSGTIPAMEVSGALADSEAQFRRLGKYRLLKTLGHGGMGTVWLGQDGFGNYAAIKTLIDPASEEKTQVIRFEREAQVMSQLNHRNICRIIEMSEFDGIRFIAMEYVTGVTLADLLENVPGQPETSKHISTGKEPAHEDLPSIVREIQKKKQDQMLRKRRRSSDPPVPVLRLGHTISLFMKICDAVEFAHGKGILHRDLKPGNVLIREDGDPVVSDFGLAKLRQGNEAFDVSHTGQVVGTLAYMAPEQSQSSKDVDERADVFSLGAIFYRMLSGADQYRTTGNFAADVQALQSHEPPLPSKVRPSIPEDLDAIVMKALGKSPAVRYRSVQALRDDVARFQSGEAVRARPPSTTDMAFKLYQRHRAIINSVGGAALFAVFLVIFSLWSITGQRNDALAARQQAESEKRKADLARSEAEASLRTLKEQQEANAALATQISAMEAAPDIHAMNPDVPFAETLLPPGTTAGEFAGARIGDARQHLRRLAESSQLRNAVVTRTADDQWQPFPSEVMAGLEAAAEAAASARIVAPESGEALLLGGCCAMLGLDPEGAAEMFRRALRCPIPGDTRERCEKLLEAAAHDPGAEASVIPQDIVPSLHSTGHEEDKVVARILSSLSGAINGGDGLTIGDCRGILRLAPGEREIAAIFLSGNPGGILDVEIEGGETAKPRLYVNGRDVRSLKPLEEITRRLASAHPEKTWTVNVSHTAAEEIPLLLAREIVASHSLVSRIKVSAVVPLDAVDLSASPVRDPSGLLRASSLRDLKLNGCPIDGGEKLWDPSESRFAKNLKGLEMAGVPLKSLDGITRMAALERFKFSPDLVADRASIRQLKAMPLLKHISSDGEPDDQPAEDFWRRHPHLN